MAEHPSPRTWFGPVVLVGLAAAALTSVCSGKAWFSAAIDYKLVAGAPEPQTRADMPLALALSLVVLAGWGALLVTRGVVRRVVATIAVLAALGVVACLAAAPFTLPSRIRDQLPGVEGGASVSPTGWYLTAVVVGVVSAASLLAAWTLVPRWPSMSTRYDAPAAASSSPVAVPEDASSTELWKALDEGRDPTEPAGPPAHRPDRPLEC
jgi:uncharacterized membrane protein (TIGR02234 family)